MKAMFNRFRNWWFFKVQQYFTYLAIGYSKRISDYSSTELSQVDLLTIAKAASDRICVESGMCASKSWNDRPGKPTPGAKFEASTRDRHDAVTNMLLDRIGKPIPPPVEGIKSVLNVTEL